VSTSTTTSIIAAKPSTMATSILIATQSFTHASAKYSTPTMTVYPPDSTNWSMSGSPSSQLQTSGKGVPDAKTAVLMTVCIAGISMIFLSIGLLTFFCLWKRHCRRQKAKSSAEAVQKQPISQPPTAGGLPPSQSPPPPRPPRPPSPTPQTTSSTGLARSRQEHQQEQVQESNSVSKAPSRRLPAFLVNYSQQRGPGGPTAPIPPKPTHSPDIRKYPPPPPPSAASYDTNTRQSKPQLAGLPITPKRSQNGSQTGRSSHEGDRNPTPSYKSAPSYDTKTWKAAEYLPSTKLHTGERSHVQEEPPRRSAELNQDWEVQSPASSLDEYYGTIPTSMVSPRLWQPLQPRKPKPSGPLPPPPSGYAADIGYQDSNGSDNQRWEQDDRLPPLPMFPKRSKSVVRLSELPATGADPESTSRYETEHIGGPRRSGTPRATANSGAWTEASVVSFQSPIEVLRKGMI